MGAVEPMAKYEDREKRGFRRYKVNCITLLYKAPRFLGVGVRKTPRRAELSNLSWRGLKFHTPYKLKVGAVIDVDFECLVDSGHHTADFPTKAKVLWRQWSTRHQMWRVGAIFLDMTEVQRNAVLKMLEKAVAFDHLEHDDYEVI